MKIDRGLGIALVALLFLAWLAAQVHAGRTMEFDLLVRNHVHEWAVPALTVVMHAFTVAGSGAFLTALAVLLVLHWHRQGRKRLALIFALTLVGAEVLEQSMKFSFHRVRPVPFFGLSTPWGYSFPSGHALMSCCFYGVWAAVVRHRRRRLPWLAAALTIAAIGFSRVYLGVHYPTDVIGGYATGVVWVLVVRAVSTRSGRAPS